ncbi:hypothetical protein [Allocoleopsis sp.]
MRSALRFTRFAIACEKGKCDRISLGQTLLEPWIELLLIDGG